MSNKLTDTEKLILDRIKCYIDDQITLERYEKKLKILQDNNSNSIAQYGTEYIRVNSVSSKVENHVVKKEEINEKIIELQTKITELENAKNKLKKGQKVVIDELLTGAKMTVIAQKMKKSKQQIYKLRKNALKNMQKFLGL